VTTSGKLPDDAQIALEVVKAGVPLSMLDKQGDLFLRMVDTGVAAAVLQRGNLTREMCVALLGTHAIDKVANRDLKVSGGRWLTGPLRDARRPPSTLLYPVLRAILCRPVPNLRVAIRIFCNGVSQGEPRRAGAAHRARAAGRGAAAPGAGGGDDRAGHLRRGRRLRCAAEPRKAFFS
jgi:hypothetical protein